MPPRSPEEQEACGLAGRQSGRECRFLPGAHIRGPGGMTITHHHHHHQLTVNQRDLLIIRCEYYHHRPNHTKSKAMHLKTRRRDVLLYSPGVLPPQISLTVFAVMWVLFFLAIGRCCMDFLRALLIDFCVSDDQVSKS